MPLRGAPLAVLALASLTSCANAPAAEIDTHSASVVEALDFVEVAPAGDGFVLAASGARFTPFGFNYDRDNAMRLLEHYWVNEMPKVERDLLDAKQLRGATVVRIHIQLETIMDGPNQPNAAALERLASIVDYAEEIGLYLDITGLNAYEQGGQPQWAEQLSREERWEAQANFWRAVAARVGSSPAVFCYDLMNEPKMPDEQVAPTPDGDLWTPDAVWFPTTTRSTSAGRRSGTNHCGRRRRAG